MERLAKLLEDIAITSTASVSVLHEEHARKQAILLQETSETRRGVFDLSDTFGGVDVGLLKIQDDIATSSTATVSVLRKEHTETRSKILQQLGVTQSGVSVLADAVKRFDLALRARPTREEIGRLISKPGQLKDLCDIMEVKPGLTSSQQPRYRSRINLERRTCVCRKRVIRSRQARLWGPWQALTDTSTTHYHVPDCIYHTEGAAVSSTRWAVAFKGLQGRINRAIEVSFSYSFGAGGCSLGPGFNYYPTIDPRRDPAFRIISLLDQANIGLDKNADFAELVDQCFDNMALLYRRGIASPKAVDLWGCSVLHYFHRLLVVGLPYYITQPKELLTKKIRAAHATSPCWQDWISW